MKIFDLIGNESAVKRLISNQKLSSNGFYSEVYEVGNYILKRYRDDKGYDLFLDFVAKNKPNTHLPKIYDIMSSDKDTYVLMEKLYHLDEDLSFQLDEAFYNMGIEEVHPLDWEFFNLGKSFDSTLNLLVDLLPEEECNIVWDMHPRNVMRRWNGTLVITDPLAGQ